MGQPTKKQTERIALEVVEESVTAQEKREREGRFVMRAFDEIDLILAEQSGDAEEVMDKRRTSAFTVQPGAPPFHPGIAFTSQDPRQTITSLFNYQIPSFLVSSPRVELTSAILPNPRSPPEEPPVLL
jgi:hypothetical protein